MSKNDENKKSQRAYGRALVYQRPSADIIANCELTTGQEIAKKLLPEALGKEIIRTMPSLEVAQQILKQAGEVYNNEKALFIANADT